MTISIIGAGKMAHQLGLNLVEAGHSVVEVYNRSQSVGRKLSSLLDARFNFVLNDMSNDIDILIIAVSDDAIRDISNTLDHKKWKEVLIVHTSGSASLDHLKNHKRKGVFYPFQTMSTTQKVNFDVVPILITSPDISDLEALKTLALSISEKCFEIKDEQRSVLHIAGVFANNFTNHLITISKDLLEQNDLNFEIIRPLIRSTFEKINSLEPADCQTGPAVRGDHQTLLQHLNWLEKNTSHQALYGLLTKSIMERHEQDTSVHKKSHQ